jgi:RING-type zinc-finger
MSLELPSLPAATVTLPAITRHRRSVSEGVLSRRIAIGTLERVHSQYSIDKSQPWCSLRNTTTTTTSTTQNTTSIPIPPPLPHQRKYSIPIPPPLPPPPHPKRTINIPHRTIKDAVAVYNHDADTDAPQPQPPQPLQPASLPSQPVPCSVCFEEVIPKDFVMYYPCLHSFCKDCVKENVRVLVSIGHKLTCLYPNCKSTLPAEMVFHPQPFFFCLFVFFVFLFFSPSILI